MSRRAGPRVEGRAAALVLFTAWLAIGESGAATEREFAVQREHMVQEITGITRETAAETGRPTIAARVLDAMRKVPRHLFVPADQQDSAYRNRPLPIGHGQTISQPFIVAIMTELLELSPGDKVLEIGTGSGYQAAVLAEMGATVHTIEIIEPLAKRASEALAAAGYDKVQVRVGDGYYGWPEAAPFDAVIVTAAASHVPPPLVEQLKPGGRMVIPVGTAFLVQHLLLVEKMADGGTRTRQVLPVRFVPLTGGH